jgi:hypothetical protein
LRLNYTIFGARSDDVGHCRLRGKPLDFWRENQPFRRKKEKIGGVRHFLRSIFCAQRVELKKLP